MYYYFITKFNLKNKKKQKEAEKKAYNLSNILLINFFFLLLIQNQMNYELDEFSFEIKN